ncbi:MAG: winged helix-turn-helix domain-containing protein [Candidatus Bathyarchaeia archaeon]|jgi:DNA-binding transcriptional ArsR family regulator
MSDMNSERQRAEIFDILSHPVRIRILKTLSRKPMSFSELKKETSIESSGHLDFHMNKLDGLIKSDENGRYVLSDQGKDALFTLEKVEEYANDEQKTMGRSALAPRKVVMAMLCLSIIILAAGVYASDIKLSVSYVTTQDQYFYTLTQGDVNTPEGVVFGPNNFSVPAESVFSFTNAVVENYTPLDESGFDWVKTVAALPLSNETFNQSSYSVFNVEISHSERMTAVFVIRGPIGSKLYEELFDVSAGRGDFDLPFSAPVSEYGNYTLSIANLTNQTLAGNLKVYCSPITETAEPVVGNLTFSSGPRLVTAIYSVPVILESEISVKPYLILGQLVSYASLVAIGALSMVVVGRRRPLKKEIRCVNPSPS